MKIPTAESGRWMERKSQRKLDDPAQSSRFIEAARKAEADETEEGADRAFKAIALPKKNRPKENSR